MVGNGSNFPVPRSAEESSYRREAVIEQTQTLIGAPPNSGAIVGEHRRRFGRGQTIYDPWHYRCGVPSFLISAFQT